MDNETTTAGAVRRRDRVHERVRVECLIYPGVADLRIRGKQFPLTFAEGDVENLNRDFLYILEDLRLEVEDGVQLDAASCQRYLGELRDAGRAAYNKVVPPAARDFIAEEERKARKQNRGISMTFRTPPTFPLGVVLSDAIRSNPTDRGGVARLCHHWAAGLIVRCQGHQPTRRPRGQPQGYDWRCPKVHDRWCAGYIRPCRAPSKALRPRWPSRHIHVRCLNPCLERVAELRS